MSNFFDKLSVRNMTKGRSRLHRRDRHQGPWRDTPGLLVTKIVKQAGNKTARRIPRFGDRRQGGGLHPRGGKRMGVQGPQQHRMDRHHRHRPRLSEQGHRQSARNGIDSQYQAVRCGYDLYPGQLERLGPPPVLPRHGFSRGDMINLVLKV